MCMQGSACTVVVVLEKSEDEAVVFEEEEEVEALGEECIELEEEVALEEGEEDLSFVPDIFFCCICFVSVFYRKI